MKKNRNYKLYSNRVYNFINSDESVSYKLSVEKYTGVIIITVPNLGVFHIDPILYLSNAAKILTINESYSNEGVDLDNIKTIPMYVLEELQKSFIDEENYEKAQEIQNEIDRRDKEA